MERDGIEGTVFEGQRGTKRKGVDPRGPLTEFLCIQPVGREPQLPLPGDRCPACVNLGLGKGDVQDSPMFQSYRNTGLGFENGGEFGIAIAPAHSERKQRIFIAALDKGGQQAGRGISRGPWFATVENRDGILLRCERAGACGADNPGADDGEIGLRHGTREKRISRGRLARLP